MDGTFDLASELKWAVQQPSITLEKIEAFRAAAKAVQAGESSPAQAQADIEQISEGFTKIWLWTNANAGALSVLIAILTLIVTYYTIYTGNEGSKQAHEDAVNQLRATEKLIEATGDVARSALTAQEVLDLIDAEQRKLSRPSLSPSQPKTDQAARSKGMQMQQLSAGGPNRHERRKAEKLGRGKTP